MKHRSAPADDLASSLAIRASGWTASPAAFALAVATIVVWAVAGPFFAFSEAWQLVINTITMIVPFVMLFLIEHEKARRGKAMHAKLDALLARIRRRRHAARGAARG